MRAQISQLFSHGTRTYWSKHNISVVVSNLRILCSLICRLMKAVPFCSESLDSLAECMNVINILKNKKCQRYYGVPNLTYYAMPFAGIVLFDTNLLHELQPDELLAVGAHEFTHIIKKHTTKRFLRIYLLPVVICLILLYVVLIHLGLPAIFVAPPVFLLVASFYINANWSRQEETECDLATVEFGYGEAMISALNKISNLHAVNEKSLLYRLLYSPICRLIPKNHPTFKQRISDIQKAMRQRKSRS